MISCLALPSLCLDLQIYNSTPSLLRKWSAVVIFQKSELSNCCLTCVAESHGRAATVYLLSASGEPSSCPEFKECLGDEGKTVLETQFLDQGMDVHMQMIKLHTRRSGFFCCCAGSRSLQPDSRSYQLSCHFWVLGTALHGSNRWYSSLFGVFCELSTKPLSHCFH